LVLSSRDEIYGASLIGVAALALALSGRLDDVTARERIPSAVPVGAHAEGSRG
jgi:hypothetical protein